MQSMIKYLLATLLAMTVGLGISYAEVGVNKEPAKAVKEVSRNKKADLTAPVNINKADAAELATLTGLGPKKAEAVLSYRKEHGEFKTIDELAEVKGVGKKGFARLLERNAGRIVLK